MKKLLIAVILAMGAYGRASALEVGYISDVGVQQKYSNSFLTTGTTATVNGYLLDLKVKITTGTVTYVLAYASGTISNQSIYQATPTASGYQLITSSSVVVNSMASNGIDETVVHSYILNPQVYVTNITAGSTAYIEMDYLAPKAYVNGSPNW